MLRIDPATLLQPGSMIPSHADDIYFLGLLHRQRPAKSVEKWWSSGVFVEQSDPLEMCEA
jgi:hypothetical protein